MEWRLMEGREDRVRNLQVPVGNILQWRIDCGGKWSVVAVNGGLLLFLSSKVRASV